MTEQLNEYDLTSVGIAQPIRIRGALQILKSGCNCPVVFLIDERHELECISQNADNALTLFTQCDVSLVGVESEYGGYEWDQYDEKYLERFDRGESGKRANEWPQFAEALKKRGAKVLGVECHGLAGKLECTKLEQNLEDIGENTLNVNRSEHFIRTLFQLRSSHGLCGNMILNVGGNHNTHIAAWIEDGSIETKTGHKAAYVRLRAPAYREQ
jgi:hypothetical protein